MSLFIAGVIFGLWTGFCFGFYFGEDASLEDNTEARSE